MQHQHLKWTIQLFPTPIGGHMAAIYEPGVAPAPCAEAWVTSWWNTEQDAIHQAKTVVEILNENTPASTEDLAPVAVTSGSCSYCDNNSGYLTREHLDGGFTTTRCPKCNTIPNEKVIQQARLTITEKVTELWKEIWELSDEELDALQNAPGGFAATDLKGMAELLAFMAGGELTVRADSQKRAKPKKTG